MRYRIPPEGDRGIKSEHLCERAQELVKTTGPQSGVGIELVYA
jgi:hypothetical protein